MYSFPLSPSRHLLHIRSEDEYCVDARVGEMCKNCHHGSMSVAFHRALVLPATIVFFFRVLSIMLSRSGTRADLFVHPAFFSGLLPVDLHRPPTKLAQDVHRSRKEGEVARKTFHRY